ncbi:hypothetical protein [Pedococcus soli]
MARSLPPPSPIRAGSASEGARPRRGGELVTDGVDGLLVPPGDVAALAGALDRGMGDAALRERLGRAARATTSAYSRDRVDVLREEPLSGR